MPVAISHPFVHSLAFPSFSSTRCIEIFDEFYRIHHIVFFIFSSHFFAAAFAFDYSLWCFRGMAHVFLRGSMAVFMRVCIAKCSPLPLSSPPFFSHQLIHAVSASICDVVTCAAFCLQTRRTRNGKSSRGKMGEARITWGAWDGKWYWSEAFHSNSRLYY